MDITVGQQGKDGAVPEHGGSIPAPLETPAVAVSSSPTTAAVTGPWVPPPSPTCWYPPPPPPHLAFPPMFRYLPPPPQAVYNQPWMGYYPIPPPPPPPPPQQQQQQTPPQQQQSPFAFQEAHSAKEDVLYHYHSTEHRIEESDQAWVDMRFGKSRVPKTTRPAESQDKFNISDAMANLREAILLVGNMKAIQLYLSENINVDDKTWEERLNQVAKLKEKFLSTQSRWLTSECLDGLRRKLASRKKKRDRKRRGRIELQEEKNDMLEHRQKLHVLIDNWRKSHLDKVSKIQKERELKKEADSILGEVRRKKAEVDKALELVKAVKKLREVKKQSIQQKGLYTTVEADESFSKTICTLETLLHKHIQEYSAEKHALQVMMDLEHKETEQSKQKHLQQQETDKILKLQNQMVSILFGERDVDAHHPYSQFFMQAEHNLEALLNIRSEWDALIVRDGTPGGTSTPPSWVVPSEPSSDVWESTLQ